MALSGELMLMGFAFCGGISTFSSVFTIHRDGSSGFSVFGGSGFTVLGGGASTNVTVSPRPTVTAAVPVASRFSAAVLRRMSVSSESVE